MSIVMPDPQSAVASRLRRLASRARTLGVIYLVVLFTATHVPANPNLGFSMADKVQHFVSYGMLTFIVLVGWEMTIGVLQAKHYFAMWLAGTLYATFDELTQIPVGRRCDVNDWAADILGIVVGLVAFRLLRGPLYRMLFIGDALRVQ
jgi:VanZ family protein